MNKSQIKEIYLPYPKKGERKIWIYLPQCDDGEKLPVIYMTDGQNLFDEKNSVFGTWDIINAIEREFAESGKKAAVVGIDNGNSYRDNELTPASIGEVILPESMDNFSNPEGEIFDSFLMHTVIPYIEKNFPVSINRGEVAVCGSSSGGLQAFFTSFEHSEKFGFSGIFSPAFLLYGADSFRNYISTRMKGTMPYLYIYTGAGDELENQIFESVEMVYDLLIECGYPYDKMNEVILFENQHNEKAWKEIFPDFLHTFLNL